MQIICENCGAVLNEEMKFCYKCGTKVPVMAAAPKRADSTASENYGEVLGSEKYHIFDYDVDEHNAVHMSIKDHHSPLYKDNHEAYYNNRYYYVYYNESKEERDRGNYLFSSRTDGSDVKVITRLKLKDRWRAQDKIFVNHNGIYLIKDKRIIALDFKGKKIISVKSEKLISYYICDTKIFVVYTDSSEDNYSAKWIDINEKVWHKIDSIKARKTTFDNRGGKIDFIMANSKRVVMWMHFFDYYYPEDDEKIREWELGGWYSYEFETEELFCIDKTRFCPHFIETQPKIIEEYIHSCRYQEKVNLTQIAAFDMEKDLMWVKTEIAQNGNEIWEPRKIGPIEVVERDKRYSCWKIPGEVQRSTNGVYFDGKHLYVAENVRNLYHYDKDGNKSENLKTDPSHPADSFRVCGNKLFFINSLTHIDQQFSMITKPSASLRMNWMEYSGHYSGEEFQNDEHHKEAIIRFLYEKAGAASSQKESYHDSASPQTMSQPAQPTGGSGKGLRLKSQLNQSTQSSVCSGKGLHIRNDSSSQSTQPEKTVTSKLEYWQEFVDYAFEGTQNQKFKSGFPRAEPADRNWYALRLGSAKVHIELSVNTQKETIRVAILVKDEEMFYQLESKLADNPQIIVDRKSQTKSMSMMRKGGLNKGRKAQFDWFMDRACVMKDFVKKYTNI